MQKIIKKSKQGGVTLCDHITSQIQNICLPKVKEPLHPMLVLQCVEDGLGNLIKRLKDWHEIMLKHTNARNKISHK